MKWIAAVAFVIGVASAVEDKDLAESGVRLETLSTITYRVTHPIKHLQTGLELEVILA